jgi:hypothetical protein
LGIKKLIKADHITRTAMKAAVAEVRFLHPEVSVNSAMPWSR